MWLITQKNRETNNQLRTPTQQSFKQEIQLLMREYKIKRKRNYVHWFHLFNKEYLACICLNKNRHCVDRPTTKVH